LRLKEKIDANMKVKLVARAMSFDEIVCDPFVGIHGGIQLL
jgi:hypothetical protein